MPELLRTAEVYPASLQAKGNGYKYQAWCQICQDGTNTKSRVAALNWAHNHNEAEGHRA